MYKRTIRNERKQKEKKENNGCNFPGLVKSENMHPRISANIKQKKMKKTYHDQTTENQQQRENHLIKLRCTIYKKNVFLKIADIGLEKKMPEDTETFGVSAERIKACQSRILYQ